MIRSSVGCFGALGKPLIKSHKPEVPEESSWYGIKGKLF